MKFKVSGLIILLGIVIVLPICCYVFIGIILPGLSNTPTSADLIGGKQWPPETVPDDAHPIKWTGENFAEFTDVFDGPMPQDWTAPMNIPSGRRFHITPIIPGTFVAIKTDQYEVVQDWKGIWYNQTTTNPFGFSFSNSYVQIRAANRSSIGRRCVVSMVR